MSLGPREETCLSGEVGRNFRKEILEDTVTLRPKLIWEPPESPRGCYSVRSMCGGRGAERQGDHQCVQAAGQTLVLAQGWDWQRETGEEGWGQLGGF